MLSTLHEGVSRMRERSCGLRCGWRQISAAERRNSSPMGADWTKDWGAVGLRIKRERGGRKDLTRGCQEQKEDVSVVRWPPDGSERR